MRKKSQNPLHSAAHEKLDDAALRKLHASAGPVERQRIAFELTWRRRARR